MAEACHESPEITAPTTPKRCSRTFAPRYVQGASTCDSIPTVTSTIEERFPRPSVMGVVNVTPDSFSDGGANLDPDDAAATARRMVAEGAAIVDVGGESTRPGSAGVTVDEELRRIVPVLERLGGEVPVSIDTAKAEVARRALALGAELVNDVTALRGDPELAGVVADAGCYVCLMHMQGEPRTMQERPTYADVASEVAAFLEERLGFAVGGGHRRAARLPRSRNRLRQDRRAELRARRSPRRAPEAGTAGARRLLAQELARPRAGRCGRDAPARSPRRSRPPSRRTSAARRSSACTT